MNFDPSPTFDATDIVPWRVCTTISSGNSQYKFDQRLIKKSNSLLATWANPKPTAGVLPKKKQMSWMC